MLEAVKATAKQHVNPVQLENFMARPTATQMHSFFRPLSASVIGIIPGKFYRAVKSETFSPSLHRSTFLSKQQSFFLHSAMERVTTLS